MIQSIVSATDSNTVRHRQSLHLPAVADSAIQVVSNSRSCARALASDNSDMDLGGAVASGVYLIRSGTAYVTSNPKYPSGEFTQHLVLDSTFRPRASCVK